jgi:hypothetical protein
MAEALTETAIRKTLSQVFAFKDFLDLVPFPSDLEEACAYGDEREALADAMLAIAVLSLRKLDDFVRDQKQKPDDVIVVELGVSAEDVLNGATGLLTIEERTKANKLVAHLTSYGFIEANDYDEYWGEVIDRCTPALERLSRTLFGQERVRC